MQFLEIVLRVLHPRSTRPFYSRPLSSSRTIYASDVPTLSILSTRPAHLIQFDLMAAMSGSPYISPSARDYLLPPDILKLVIIRQDAIRTNTILGSRINISLMFDSITILN